MLKMEVKGWKLELEKQPGVRLWVSAIAGIKERVDKRNMRTHKDVWTASQRDDAGKGGEKIK